MEIAPNPQGIFYHTPRCYLFLTLKNSLVADDLSVEKLGGDILGTELMEKFGEIRNGVCI